MGLTWSDKDLCSQSYLSENPVEIQGFHGMRSARLLSNNIKEKRRRERKEKVLCSFVEERKDITVMS